MEHPRPRVMEDLHSPAFLTLDNAVGSIQAGPEQQARLDEITERLMGREFFVAVDGVVPSRCIDGRSGSLPPAPNSAGGSETLMVADDLTQRRFLAQDESTLGAYTNLLHFLAEYKLPIGGHTDTHASDSASGCGANDKLDLIYSYLEAYDEVVREVAANIGVPVDDATHATIMANVWARGTFSEGSELLARLRAGGDAAVDMLQGEHHEVVAVINTAAGTTLDRTALAAEFGTDYEAFNIDTWSFPAAAEAIAVDEATVPALVAAMAYYNVATAHVLCGPNMRVVVRR